MSDTESTWVRRRSVDSPLRMVQELGCREQKATDRVKKQGEYVAVQFNKPRKSPEKLAAGRLRRYMENQGWLIKKLHGGKYQSGLPDLVAFHAVHGMRWIETKNIGEKLRVSQRELFADMALHGEKIFVLHDQNDYHKIFDKSDNWRSFL